jgi:hypothetical protein
VENVIVILPGYKAKELEIDRSGSGDKQGRTKDGKDEGPGCCCNKGVRGRE